MEDDNVVVFHDGRLQSPRSKNTQSEDTSIDTSDMRKFLANPVPRGAVVECFIIRHKEGFMNKYPAYECRFDDRMQKNNAFMMSGKRQPGNKSSNYWISTDKMKMDHNSPTYLGKVRSNFVGTEFVIYDDGVSPKKAGTDSKHVRLELGAVIFGANIGANHPRDMTVILPKNEKFQDQSESSGTVGIITRYQKHDSEGLFLLQQKKPQWNEKLKAYTLNFHGRVTMASVKNFQLAYRDSEDDVTNEIISLQFGKVDSDRFTMDVRWPLSPYLAFAICLASFDPKLACEG